MKKLLLMVLLFLSSNIVNAQSVAINTDKSAANPSAMLDVKSNTKGLLIPRTSTTSRLAITNPAKGLMLYDTTAGSFWFYNGTAWNALSSGSATNYWKANGTNINNNNSGNVGIGTNNPLASLHIKKDNEALRIEGTSSYLSFYNNAGTVPKVFMQNTGDNLYLGTSSGNSGGITQFYSNNAPLMTLAASGNIGIGTTAPVSKLDVKTPNNTNGISHTGDGGNILATRMGGTSAGIGTFSPTNMRIFANNYSAIFISEATGNVGINTDDNNPLFKLDVAGRMRLRTQSDGNSAGIWFNNPANTIPIAFVGVADASTVGIYGNNSSWALAMNTNTGNVGIQTLVSANRLQIGSLGTTGFAGNDLAIGNGTNAMAIYQSNTATVIGSTTDIILRPRNNGQGRVGINTNTPRASLDVSYAVNVNSVNGNYGYGYLEHDNANDVTGFSTDDNPVQNVSIIASGRIYAREFDAFSDARIKTISGITNSQQDLQTINALAITNYTMKDKVMYGNQQFKKVIAQEVEKVYPQVVSKHRDFIPNVYQLTNTLKHTTEGLLLSFISKHNISINAKKLQVLVEGKGMQQLNIVAIPSANEVIIDATDLKNDKVFVYGEEVDDFRTVDYEGLTTLNISATQELNKLLKEQQKINTLQNKKIAEMAQTIELLKMHSTRPSTTLKL